MSVPMCANLMSVCNSASMCQPGVNVSVSVSVCANLVSCASAGVCRPGVSQSVSVPVECACRAGVSQNVSVNVTEYVVMQCTEHDAVYSVNT